MALTDGLVGGSDRPTATGGLVYGSTGSVDLCVGRRYGRVMWPWGHAALGYLLYVIYLRLRSRERPTGRNVIALLLGTQTPDLIDKPLAWYLHVLEYGRSLAHSMLTGGMILFAVVLYLRHRGHRKLATAFAIGYLSHLVGDSYTSALAGNWEYLAFLVWPLLPIPGADREVEGLFAHLARLDASVIYSDGVLLAASVFVLWLYQGAPGVWTLLEWVRRATGRAEEPIG